MSVGEWREVMAVASRVLRGLRPTRCRSARTSSVAPLRAAISPDTGFRLSSRQIPRSTSSRVCTGRGLDGAPGSGAGCTSNVSVSLPTATTPGRRAARRPTDPDRGTCAGPSARCRARAPCTRWRTSTTSHSRICYVLRLRDILDLGGVDRAPCGKQPTPRGPATSRSTPRVNSGGRLAASPTVGPVAHAGCGGTRPGTVGGRGTAASRETGWRPASTAADAHQRRGLHPLRPGVSPVGPTRLPCCAAVMVPPGPPSPRRRRARASSAAPRSRPRGASAHR